MGGIATAGNRDWRSTRGAQLAKKALSIRPPKHTVADARPHAGRLKRGERGAAVASRQGRVAWPATLLKGRPRQRLDLCWVQRSASPHELWVVIVDASASTRRYKALSHAKGLLAEFFDQAYRQRARLALLTASGKEPRWQRQGLKASRALGPWLEVLGAGGGTPLLAALEQARQWLLHRAKRYPDEQRRCLILTDGRLSAWPALQALPCTSLLIDMEMAPIRLGRARLMAEQLQADYQHIEQFKPL